MAWETIYRCDRCKTEQRVHTGEYRFYQVAWQDKTIELFDRVSCSVQAGWCRRCCRLRTIEEIPDLNLLQMMRSELAEKGFVAGELDLVTRPLAWIDDRIRWRRERFSPAKCFACGSIEVESAARSDQEKILHAGCGGLFRAFDSDHFVPSMAYLVPSEGPPGESFIRLTTRLWQFIDRRNFV